MAYTNEIALVRMLIADRKKIIRNLQLGVGDGSEDIFRVPILTVQTLLSGLPDLNITVFDPDTEVYIDALISAFDYETGDVQITPIPATGQIIIGYFSYVTFTDTEITFILNRPEVVKCPYTCAAILINSILADVSRFVSFSQGGAKYNFDEVSKRLERLEEKYLRMSPITADSISVPFVPDVLSRLNYIAVPIISAEVPYARW